MKTRLASATCLAMIAAMGCFAAPDREATETEAKAIVKTFVGEVRPMLQNYMKSRGPVGAVEGCAAEAPAIADRLSDATGWSVGRVSLQPRNTDRGTPDAWETATLQQLEQKRKNGAAAEELNYGEWVDGRFRYMQAQIVEGACLTCHGKSLDPAVQAIISQYYPDDSATEFSLGDIRGAVTLGSPAGD